MTATLANTFRNYDSDWHTPPEWLEWVTETLGAAWFDPCPSGWKQSKHHSGLDLAWTDPTYCNHPGSRGSAQLWWRHWYEQRYQCDRFIWCAFNCEQLRHLNPSPFMLTGYLVLPRQRIAFIRGATGERGKSPGNWTVFWSTVRPTTPPIESIIVPTGNVIR